MLIMREARTGVEGLSKSGLSVAVMVTLAKVTLSRTREPTLAHDKQITHN